MTAREFPTCIICGRKINNRVQASGPNLKYCKGCAGFQRRTQYMHRSKRLYEKVDLSVEFDKIVAYAKKAIGIDC
jgi:ribosome-binding protein aMBF1 (putative translation factor)